MADRAEIAKHIERAEKLLQKGKTVEALDSYMIALAADPENNTVRQMAADLNLSLKRNPEAVRLLGELFERQIAASDAPRASLTYKKLSRLSNPEASHRLKLAQLQEKSNPRQSLEIYESVLDEMITQDKKAEGIDVLKAILALDPVEKNMIRLAELSASAGDHRAAANAYMKLAAQAQPSETANWYEHAYEENPADEEIALAYANSLIAQQQVGAAIFILEPLASTENASADLRDAYAKALLSTGRIADAEPVMWKLFEADSTRTPEIGRLIEALLEGGQDAQGVALARKLEQFQRRKGDRRGFITLMQSIVAKHKASADLLEFMSELFNASNREGDYSQTLLKLFDLHYGMGNFPKAADCLDKAAEIDAYEPGHQKRLESLRGKIDENRYQVVASRFTSAAPPAAQNQERTLGVATLQDLMLQAEILVQYGMLSQAVGRLQRISEFFPREEDRNPELRALYSTAGFQPQYAASAEVAAATVAPVVTAAPVVQAAAAPVDEVNTFARVAEIARKLNRQNNAETVLSTTAAEIGAQWNANRCVAAMRKPGQSASLVKEHCGSGVTPAAPAALAQVIAAVHELTISSGVQALNNARSLPELENVRPALVALQVAALLAIPLSDGSDHAGVLILTHPNPRAWSANEVAILKTIAEQVVIALNNVGLRRLVKNLSVTDEDSGLLKRSSYLDLLLAESKRSLQQNAPLTVALIDIGEKSALIRDFGEAAIEAAMQQVGQVFTGNIRQHDLAFRYGPTSIALILGETGAPEAEVVIEKLRKLSGLVKFNDHATVTFCAGVAEAVFQQQYDSVDSVTEVINRAERALESAVSQGPGKTLSVAAALTSAAVA